jgi:hypothetical protein
MDAQSLKELMDFERELAQARKDCMEGKPGSAELMGRVTALIRETAPPVSKPPPPQPAQEPVRGTGWVDSVPLGPPPGVKILDQIMDHMDAKDRAERIVDAAIDRARRVAISAATQERATNVAPNATNAASSKPTGTPVQPAAPGKSKT